MRRYGTLPKPCPVQIKIPSSTEAPILERSIGQIPERILSPGVDENGIDVLLEAYESFKRNTNENMEEMKKNYERLLDESKQKQIETESKLKELQQPSSEPTPIKKKIPHQSLGNGAKLPAHSSAVRTVKPIFK